MSQTKYEGKVTGFFILFAIVTLVVIILGGIYLTALRAYIPSDLRRFQSGFLRTNASTASDISLLAYVFLLLPGMLLGFRFARRMLFVPHHKFMMTAITVVNWGIILYLMAVSYAGVAPSVPDKLRDPGVLIPSIHLLCGVTAQIIATVSVIRMWLEYRLPGLLRYEPIKPQMRLTLALWLITALLGIATYINFYGVPFTGRPNPVVSPGLQPAATQDAGGPSATQDAQPAATQDAQPAATQDAEKPVATQDATNATPEPVATPAK